MGKLSTIEKFIVAIIVVMVVVIFVRGIGDAPRNTATRNTQPDIQSLVDTFREAENELKKFQEVDAVYFSSDEDTGELVIELEVNDLADENFLSEVEDETGRVFLHALVDNWNIPSAITGGGVI